MIFPFESLAHSEFGLVGAVVLGFFFGFVLERAGFGRSTTLAAQFYGYDMTVFKVMFGAIVTAMLGLVVASGFGLADFRAVAESATSATYVWPMLAGGLLLGAGFIISGYCPGTSLVSAASGHLDGLATVVGVGLGSLVFGEVYPAVKAFHLSGDMGHQFLFDLMGMPPAVVAVAVAAAAAACFLGAEVLERLFTRRRFGLDPAPARAAARPRRLVFTTYAVAGAVGLGTLLVPAGDGQLQAAPAWTPISAEALAHRLLDEPWKVWVLDVRDRSAYEKQRIPGSEHRAWDELDSFGLQYSPGIKALVLVTRTGLAAIPPAVQAYPGRVFVLEGGFAAWRRYALETPPPLIADAPPSRRAAARFQAALHGVLTGRQTPPPPPAAAARFVPPPKKKGGGCDG